MTDQFLQNLCSRHETKSIALRGETLDMRLLSAAELLELSAACGASPALMEALPGLAALAAKCLQKHGAPVFASAQEVLQVLSAEEIHAVAAAYADWSAVADPGIDSGEETIEALKKGSGTRRRNACAGVC